MKLIAIASCHGTVELNGIDAFQNGDFSEKLQYIFPQCFINRSYTDAWVLQISLHCISSKAELSDSKQQIFSKLELSTPCALDQTSRIRINCEHKTLFAFYTCSFLFLGIVNTRFLSA